MAVSVSGSLGGVTWDADGSGSTSTPIAVEKGSSYEYEEETTVEEQGPFIGDPSIEEIATGDKYTMKLEMVVPEGNDAGQTALIAARKSKVRGTLAAHTLKGKQITMTECLIKKVTIKGEAKGTQTISVEASAKDATVAAAPTE